MDLDSASLPPFLTQRVIQVPRAACPHQQKGQFGLSLPFRSISAWVVSLQFSNPTPRLLPAEA